MAKKKQRSPDLGRETAYLVAMNEMGRAMASLGSSLTGDEKSTAQHVSELLQRGIELPAGSPVTAKILRNVPGKVQKISMQELN